MGGIPFVNGEEWGASPCNHFPAGTIPLFRVGRTGLRGPLARAICGGCPQVGTEPAATDHAAIYFQPVQLPPPPSLPYISASPLALHLPPLTQAQVGLVRAGKVTHMCIQNVDPHPSPRSPRL